MWRTIAGGLVICWALLATVGDRMPEHTFLVALGLTVSVSTYVAVRGPAWYAAYRIGRLVDRELRVALAEADRLGVPRQHAPRRHDRPAQIGPKAERRVMVNGGKQREEF